MSPESITDLLMEMKWKRWATDNITVGMGGGLLQRVNRDTQRFAFKCSYIEVDGRGRDVYKDPIHKGKKSKKGRLKLIDYGGLHTVNERYGTAHGSAEITPKIKDILVTVFENGRLIRDWTLSEVRERARV